MRNRRALTDDEKETIRAMWQEGDDFRTIAAAIGREQNTPRRYLRDAGLHLPRRASAETRAAAVQWYADGLAVSLILRRFAIRESTLYADVHAAGVPLRHPAIGEARRKPPTP